MDKFKSSDDVFSLRQTELLKIMRNDLDLEVKHGLVNEYYFQISNKEFVVGFGENDDENQPVYYLRPIESQERIISSLTLEDFLQDFVLFVDEAIEPEGTISKKLFRK